VSGSWEGAVDTEKGRAFHRTVGEHRAWSDSGAWCYPGDPCEWCRGHLGEEQVWLPAEGTQAHEALLERLAAVLATRYPWVDPHPLDITDTIITALREDAP
jgi:hypothetical protein